MSNNMSISDLQLIYQKMRFDTMYKIMQRARRVHSNHTKYPV